MSDLTTNNKMISLLIRKVRKVSKNICIKIYLIIFSLFSIELLVILSIQRINIIVTMRTEFIILRRTLDMSIHVLNTEHNLFPTRTNQTAEIYIPSFNKS